MESRTIEKYLKTFISLNTSKIPLTHELMKLFDCVIENGFLKNNKELRTNIDFFDSIKNNVSYVDAPDHCKLLESPYSYGRCDIEKLDYVIYEFENVLWNNSTIEGYTFPRTNISIIRDVINDKKLSEDTVIYFKKEWILKYNNYFKTNY